MPVLMPKAEYLEDDRLLLALCVWREARGEPYEAKLGVAHTVLNRCAFAPREGFKRDIAGNILKPWAFSSFLDSDPNACKYPADGDPSWPECMRAAIAADPDPTGGAVFYFSKPLTAPPKQWGPVEQTARIAGLRFYRKLMRAA